MEVKIVNGMKLGEKADQSKFDIKSFMEEKPTKETTEKGNFTTCPDIPKHSQTCPDIPRHFQTYLDIPDMLTHANCQDRLRHTLTT